MESLEGSPREMMEVMDDRVVWRLNLKLLPRNPRGKAAMKRESDSLDKQFNFFGRIFWLIQP